MGRRSEYDGADLDLFMEGLLLMFGLCSGHPWFTSVTSMFSLVLLPVSEVFVTSIHPHFIAVNNSITYFSSVIRG